MKGSKTFMNDFKFFINLNESFTINEAKKPEPTKEEVENLRKQFEQALKKDWGEIEKSINQCIDDIGEADPDKKSKCKILNPSKQLKLVFIMNIVANLLEQYLSIMIPKGLNLQENI